MALVVVAGLSVLACVGLGIGAGVLANSAEGKKLLEGVNKTMNVVEQATNAPGAAEAVAAGCPEAGVVDLDEVMGIVSGFVDAGARAELGLMVLCQGDVLSGTLPDCAAVAKAYLTAPDRIVAPFQIEVRRKGNTTPLCHHEYDAVGALLRDHAK